MSTLAVRQADFMAQVLDDERPLPAGWTPRHAAGLAIYRNAFRVRLVDALRETYERTARWVGEDAFRAAAAHHVIQTPPNSWTLDHVTEGFVEVLEQLFAGDPEVAELAWLEWAIHRAFVAADIAPLDAAGFAAASSGFGEEDWAGLRVEFLPSLYLRVLGHDVGALWNALASDDFAVPNYALPVPVPMLVWREDLRPTFMSFDNAEGQALRQMLDGENYGEMVQRLAGQIGEEEAVMQSGAMLGGWLGNGLIAGLS